MALRAHLDPHPDLDGDSLLGARVSGPLGEFTYFEHAGDPRSGAYSDDGQ